MLELNFYPERNNPKLAEAAAEYQEIWREQGKAFLGVLETKTGLTFTETEVNALVYEGISRSHPLTLRASYPKAVKASILVHELGHRLLSSNGLTPASGEGFHINAHKLLNLFLYDVYCELFGTDGAQKAVEWESGLRASYKVCWQWALGLSENERAKRFSAIKQHKDNWLPYLDRSTYD